MPEYTIKLRRATAAQWTSANPVLALAEPGIETDTGKMKIGDGTTAWNSLDYFVDGTGGGGGAPSGAAGGDLSGTYPNPSIAAGTIVNADINASAAIATSKISGLDAAIASIASGDAATLAAAEAYADSVAGGGGGGGGIQSLAYTATLAVDASLGDTIKVGTLTGNITISAPTNPVAGQTLRFIFVQDATGNRSVTWDPIFSYELWRIKRGRNKRTTAEFIYDGTAWRLFGGVFARQWFFDVVEDFGADPTGANESVTTQAFQDCVDACLGTDITNAPYTARVAQGVFFMPDGYYSINNEIRIWSVLGFKMVGQSMYGTQIRVANGATLETPLDLNGVCMSDFRDFTVTGAGTGKCDFGMHLRWGRISVNMTSGSSTITSTFTAGETAAFRPEDVGTPIRVPGAGPAGGNLDTTIASVSAIGNTATLAANASTTVSGVFATSAARSSTANNFTNIFIGNLKYKIGFAVEQRDGRMQNDECVWTNCQMRGGNTHEDVTISNGANAVVTYANFTLANGDAVVFSTSGALPTGLTAGTTYYVVSQGVDGANKCRLAATVGGAAITTTSAGSGVHRLERADYWQYGFRGGNGTSGNTLLLHLNNCNLGWNRYGASWAGVSGSYVGGGCQENGVDFHAGGINAILKIAQVRSEEGGRFFETAGYNGQQPDVLLENNEYFANKLHPDTQMIIHRTGGRLKIDGLQVRQSGGAYTPTISCGALGGGFLDIDGIEVPTAPNALISNVSSALLYNVSIRNYIQTDANGIFVAKFARFSTTPATASAASLVLPNVPGDVVLVTGTTNITSISAVGMDGRTITLIFNSTLTVVEGNNLYINGNFITENTYAITLACDGTNFYEVSRRPGVQRLIGAHVYHSAVQALSAATWTPLTFDSEFFDTNTLHSTVTNNSRITVAKAGYYQVSGYVTGGDAVRAAGKTLYVSIAINGARTAYPHLLSGDAAEKYTNIEVNRLVYLSAGDYVELHAWVSDAMNLGNSGVAEANRLSVALLGT